MANFEDELTGLFDHEAQKQKTAVIRANLASRVEFVMDTLGLPRVLDTDAAATRSRIRQLQENEADAVIADLYIRGELHAITEEEFVVRARERSANALIVQMQREQPFLYDIVGNLQREPQLTPEQQTDQKKALMAKYLVRSALYGDGWVTAIDVTLTGDPLDTDSAEDETYIAQARSQYHEEQREREKDEWAQLMLADIIERANPQDDGRGLLVQRLSMLLAIVKLMKRRDTPHEIEAYVRSNDLNLPLNTTSMQQVVAWLDENY